ncbi:MAG: helix-turn-helix transcriptional regulator [Actinomycetota bacterium]|nr:helix-turn-helix transcriptional regulator [Actinomycetota bacterium]
MGGDAHLGQTLRGFRESRGISLKAAARALGTERHATVSEIESGRRSASFAEMVKLAEAYGLTLPDVLDAVAGRPDVLEVSVALPRAAGSLEDVDRAAIARLEKLARDYVSLKSVVES